MSAQPTTHEHLGDRLSDYVDRVLTDDELWACDRHVLICPSCTQAVEDERRLLDSLRRLDGVPGEGPGLQQSLLQLATLAPAAPEPPAPDRLTVLSCAAPAMHRSARRSVVAAGLVAAACALAAWAVVGSGPVGARAGTTPTVQRSGVVVRPAAQVTSTTSFRDASVGVVLFGVDPARQP